MPTNKVKLLLFCWVLGDQRCFGVDIHPDQAVDDLVNAIAEKDLVSKTRVRFSKLRIFANRSCS